MVNKNNDDFSELLAPAIGILGLLGLALFGLNNNKPTDNGLPPPPIHKKPSAAGGCGCGH